MPNLSGQRAWTRVRRPITNKSTPIIVNLNYGRSDYNVGKAFKLYGMWQPVFFHGNRAWVDKIVGGWSISGILNIHSGFPWTPLVSVKGRWHPSTGGSCIATIAIIRPCSLRLIWVALAAAPATTSSRPARTIPMEEQHISQRRPTLYAKPLPGVQFSTAPILLPTEARLPARPVSSATRSTALGTGMWI